jgi:crossover junction endodeoxyribonuclease RusA
VRLHIEVVGRPAPQGSKKTGGAGQLIEQSAYLPAWRTAVKVAAYKAYRAAGIAHTALPVFPQGRPVHIERCTFYMHPAQSPTGKPDIDKLLRSTLDALGGGRYRTARLYDDDSQIVLINGLSKIKTPAELRPGAYIIVSDELQGVE